MALLSLKDVSISFGGPPLLNNVNLQVEKGQRVCILGRNGEGKTTLLGLIEGRIKPDSGTISIQKGVSVAGLSQELSKLSGTVHDVVSGGLSEIESLLNEHSRLSEIYSSGHEEITLKKIGIVHEKLDRMQGWEIRSRVDTILEKMSLDPDADFKTLSVGYRRRILLARALVSNPDILLLDEPTNHLDINTIAWMEEYLEKYSGTIILVTHDRLFLKKLATRTIEIDRGNIFDWACGYKSFVERRQAVLDEEQIHRKQYLRKLAEEEEWIRKGIKARRTRNEGRVRALEKMREEQQAWRIQAGISRINIQEAVSSGKLVIEAFGITHGYNGSVIIRDFSAKIIRGDRIGIIGPNGAGKSTLLKILMGEIAPDRGNVKRGTRLETVYFDQLREQLDEDATVEQNISDGRDTVIINGVARHVIGYLKDFLFTPERSRSPVRILSGGERNRLLLARLFTRPSNLLVLDEPTNDLDMETLELFEERLLEYRGTILLVSHDRAFLNNVVTSTIVFEDGGDINEYPGGYDDWIRQRPVDTAKKESAEKSRPIKQREKKAGPRKLTFKEARELDDLPERIEILEQEQEALFRQMADPEFYRNRGNHIAGSKARIDELKNELETAYKRWEELEGIREAGL